ncbi:hypothetical protein D9758_005774 [Tetrapyrgos nigripes]|uniref:F-box domain-containing protein n=1 Tax=Tetrapyrgos nigripes TaxID=182062 RepID=A0A8H5GJZ8_9AGAR|nr:hypothetical protein D9758_005774 [Tetrapyrgos nigripes]
MSTSASQLRFRDVAVLPPSTSLLSVIVVDNPSRRPNFTVHRESQLQVVQSLGLLVPTTALIWFSGCTTMAWSMPFLLQRLGVRKVSSLYKEAYINEYHNKNMPNLTPIHRILSLNPTSCYRMGGGRVTPLPLRLSPPTFATCIGADQYILLRIPIMSLPSETRLFRPPENNYVSVITLPVEITREIFSYCCTPGLSVEGRNISAPTLILSQTCMTWKAVALGVPELWSEFSLSIDRDHPRTTEDLVDTYLSRSASSPLTLSVSAVPGDEDDEGEYYFKCLWTILESMFGNSHRWKSASFNFGEALLYKFDLFLHPEPESTSSERLYPRLKALTIITTFGSVGDSEVLSGIWKHAPVLQSLCIEGYDEDSPLLFSSELLQSLRFCNSCPSLANAFQLLTNCPNLQEFYFTIEHLEEDDDVLSPSFTHSQLRSLSCEVPSHDLCNLLSSFTFPSLTSLNLGLSIIVGSETFSVFSPMKDMFQRSGCSLRVLKLATGGLFASTEELIEILSLTPTVTDFVLNVSEQLNLLSIEFFQSLSFRDDNGDKPAVHDIILPQLESFRVAGFEDLSLESFDYPHPEAMLTMINSRRQLPTNFSNSTQLRQLARFEWSAFLGRPEIGGQWMDSFTSDIEPGLRALEREGLELSLEIERRWLNT